MNDASDETAAALFGDQSIPSTVRVVVETLFARINTEEYPADSRLPAERNLAAELGVARNTVREALNLLEAHNVINRRAGSGSFVIYKSHQLQNDVMPASSDESHQVSEATSPLQLQIMRGIIEPEMVRLAIINMAPRAIEALGDVLMRMEAIRTDAGAYSRLEDEFHLLVARGTGNPLLIACYELIMEVRQHNLRTAQQKRHLSPKRIEQYQRRYNSLYNAIALRDIENAVEIVKLHLVDEQRRLLQED
ncbi:FCD domain-containing protein [Nitratireductor sp. XY-223]|uniref:FadR/GntR family transcriptional regulator n=1 Tax=Nitratireductor sp. XY-223 TaxID=2561926 RepID=UPI00197D15BF|nr:FCD domain-containing protein [Nitratireductor sp. XY-223]